MLWIAFPFAFTLSCFFVVVVVVVFPCSSFHIAIEKHDGSFKAMSFLSKWIHTIKHLIKKMQNLNTKPTFNIHWKPIYTIKSQNAEKKCWFALYGWIKKNQQCKNEIDDDLSILSLQPQCMSEIHHNKCVCLFECVCIYIHLRVLSNANYTRTHWHTSYCDRR